MSESFSRIKEITEPDSIIGYEHSAHNYLRSKIIPLTNDVQTDDLDGIFGIRNSATENALRITVAAYMDEVGFTVSDIKANGAMCAVGIGGWNSLVLSSQRFTLHTCDGCVVPVIFGSVLPHFLRGTNGSAVFPKVDDIVFDIGFTDKAGAELLGIPPGDVVVPKSETILTVDQKNVISRAWDNRFGVLMVTESPENLKGQELDNILIISTNVQEGVDLRDAHISVAKLQPELLLAIGCSPAGGIYGNQGKIGSGTLFRFYDPRHIMLKDMHGFSLTTAEGAGIRYQHYVIKGGTDADTAHLKNGDTPSTTIGVCTRYIYLHQNLYAMDDFL